MGLPELLTLVLGGGLLATIQGITKALSAYRQGARARERDVITDSESWRISSDNARRCAEQERDWYRNYAVELWHKCWEHGGNPGPLRSPPPSRELDTH